MKMGKTLVITLLVALSPASSYAMHKFTAGALTVGATGLGAAAGAYCFYPKNSWEKSDPDYESMATWAVIGAVTSGLVTKRFCFRRTSAGYLRQATRIRRSVDRNLLALARQSTTTVAPTEILRPLESLYASSVHPRIDALRDLRTMKGKFSTIAPLLQSSQQAPEGKKFRLKNKRLLTALQEDQQAVDKVMLTIKSDPDYRTRLQLFHAGRLASATAKQR